MERRRYEHVPFFAPMTISAAAGDKTCSGSCINISRGGVGFYSERFFRPGEKITLVMEIRQGSRKVPVSIAARVIWARAEPEGAMLGAAFETPVTPSSQPVLCECLDNR